jgi:3-hydroxyisobutyrate dehydrogenase
MSTATSLEALWESCWGLLERGAADRRDPFHSPVLGTRGTSSWGVRTVILRRVVRAERALIAHSDARAGKVREMRENPEVGWVFYSGISKIQIRAHGPATVHVGDALADRQWNASQIWSRQSYLVDEPGTTLDAPGSGAPADLEGRQPSHADAERGRSNFAVIRCVVTRLDWLQIDPRGHRRASFVVNEAGEPSGRWIVP